MPFGNQKKVREQTLSISLRMEKVQRAFSKFKQHVALPQPFPLVTLSLANENPTTRQRKRSRNKSSKTTR